MDDFSNNLRQNQTPQALEAFLIGLDSRTINGWGTSNCCNWSGITCNSSFSLGFSNDPINSGKVVKLELSGKILAGKLNETTFTGLDQLTTLNLSINFLQGYFPLSLIPSRFGNCSSLEHLWLGQKNFARDIPEDIFRLPRLNQLGLRDNQFSGELSSGIGNLSDLVVLDISLNSFSGPIPDVFHRFAKLQVFYAESNNFSGGIPNSLANSRTIISLVLRNNSLNGVIDLNCSEMTHLVSISLDSNQFTGPVPDNLPLCPRLKIIGLSGNNLTGQISEIFRNFHVLSLLSLSNSTIFNLSPALDILQHCQNLTTLVLNLNFHDEQLPSYPSPEFKNMKALTIAYCGLSGVFPQWLSGLTNLQALGLSGNRLDGTIPHG
ncbi:hypothetical protein ACSBR2_040168 [Camellia fascicularis]